MGVRSYMLWYLLLTICKEEEGLLQVYTGINLSVNAIIICVCVNQDTQ